MELTLLAMQLEKERKRLKITKTELAQPVHAALLPAADPRDDMPALTDVLAKANTDIVIIDTPGASRADLELSRKRMNEFQ